MRSKTIFVILFMLSFSIMHDSIIVFVENNESSMTQSQVLKEYFTQLDTDSTDMHKVHGMFHFVGLAIATVNIVIPDYKKEDYFQNLLQYTTHYKKTSFKPPKA